MITAIVSSTMTPPVVSEPSSLDPAAQELLFRSARTPKAFLSTPVTDAQIDAIAELPQWGPTMTNAQPLRVVLARTEASRAKVLDRLMPYNRERAGAAPVLAVFCADHAFDRHMERVFPGAAPIAERYRADEPFRDRVADSQAWMQAGYWIVGVRAAGLDILPMMGFDDAAMDEMVRAVQDDLFPGSDLRSIMVGAIGHADPASYPARPPRLDRADVVAEL